MKGATPAPETAEPPSVGSRSETTEAAAAAPAATSATTALGAPSATLAAPADKGVANPMERAAPSPIPRERWPPKGQALPGIHHHLCRRSRIDP
jgi:hypothetical protein